MNVRVLLVSYRGNTLGSAGVPQANLRDGHPRSFFFRGNPMDIENSEYRVHGVKSNTCAIDSTGSSFNLAKLNFPIYRF